MKTLLLTNFRRDLVKHLTVVLFLLLLAITAFAVEYKDPLTVEIEYDDLAPNIVFDIKSDKEHYSALINDIVYFKVTNLSASNQNFDLGIFTDEDFTINWVGEWDERTRTVNDYGTVLEDINVFVDLVDIPEATCAEAGYFDVNGTGCRYIDQIEQRAIIGSHEETFFEWETAKAQQWEQAVSDRVPDNFTPKGGLTGINIGNGETKYFILDFSHDVGAKGEFYICGNGDCLDPTFLSGFLFRQQITLNTDGISLSGDITDDHTILINIPATNTDFWDNEMFGDGNGMTFTGADGETTEYDFDIEDFNSIVDDANIWVEVTETFTSGVDLNMFIYYQGDNTDFSDGTAAYRTDLNAVYHSNDADTGIVDSTSNALDMTAQATPTFSVDGQIDDAVDYDVSDFQKLSSPLSGTSGSITGWFNFDVNNANQAIFGSGDEAGSAFFSFQLSSDSFIEIQNTIGTADTIHGQTIIAANVWHHVVVTSDDVNYVLYLDGVAESLVVEEGVDNGEWFGDSADLDNATVGAVERSTVIATVDGTIDEVKVWTNTLTADDVLLLFNSENDSLITFSAQEIAPTPPPDINIVTPSATGIQIKGGSVFVIDFDVSDADNNSLLIDLNFSASSTQGTGTVIIDDTNTDSATITCDDSDFSNSTNCTFNWTTPTSDANFFILAVASDGSVQSADDFNAGANSFLIDSTVPVILTILPDAAFTKDGFNLDFNATIDDGAGSGNFRCVTRTFFNNVQQPILDLNVDGTSGTCIRTISSGVPHETFVSVGFIAVDNVGNISDENTTQQILFDPFLGTVNELCIQMNDDLAAAGGCIDDDGFEDTITSSSGLFVLESGDISGIVLLFIAISGIILIAGSLFLLRRIIISIIK